MAITSAQLHELASERPGEDSLPVLPPLRSLLPGGVLRRGSVVAVEQSRLLCVTLAVEASAAGAWCAVVGMPEFGAVAAADAGVDTGRLLLVADPGPKWPHVVAALLEGCELVLLRPPARPAAPVARRLAAHARVSGGVVVVAGNWEGAQIRFSVSHPRWTGIGAGHGRIKGRRVLVAASGRGDGRRAAQWWWLPASGGTVAPAGYDAPGSAAQDGPEDSAGLVAGRRG